MSFEAGTELKPRKLYTGLLDAEIVAVNPSVEEAAKFGMTFKEAPVYTGIDENTKAKRIRIDFWLKGINDILTKVSFFLTDSKQVSSAGNTRFINAFGQSTYAADVDAAVNMETSAGVKWFKAEGVKEARIGEPELVDFIKAWLSIGNDGVAKFDNISEIINGNVTIFKELLKKYGTRKVQVLLVVKEYEGNWYQNVYGRFFSRAGNKKTTYWEKQLSGSTAQIEYQNSFVLKEFDPITVSSSHENPLAGGDTENPWASSEA